MHILTPKGGMFSWLRHSISALESRPPGLVQSFYVEPWLEKQVQFSLQNIQKAALQKCKCQELVACCGQEEARHVNPVSLWSSCNILCHYTLQVDWIIIAGVLTQKFLTLGSFMQWHIYIYRERDIMAYLAIIIIF